MAVPVMDFHVRRYKVLGYGCVLLKMCIQMLTEHEVVQWLCFISIKGQLISKGLFDVIVWTKKPTKLL